MNPANKAWCWLAAGVLALGLNGYYQDGGLQQIHRLADSAESTIAESTAQFSQAATVAEVAFAEHLRCERPSGAAAPMIPQPAQARLAELQQRLAGMQAARVQARLARLQQVMARREMQRAPVEWQNGRILVLDVEGQVQVTLPRVEVDIPQGAVLDVSQPN